MDIIATLMWVLLVIVIGYIGLAIISWLLSATGTGQTTHDASKARSVSVGKGSDNNYTCSIWAYVSNWTPNKEKTILTKGNGAPTISLGASNNTLSVSVAHSGHATEGMTDAQGSIHPAPLQVNSHQQTITNPALSTDSKVGNLQTSGHVQAVHCGAVPPSKPASSPGGGSSGPATCVIPNFPLQTWVNVVVSVYGQTVDVYLNGKLQKSCKLPGVASPSQGDMKVTPGGGFTGYTAKAEYWPTASNPEQAYMIYLSGPGVATSTGSQGEGGGSYRLKVSFLENGKTEGSFEI